MHDVVVKRKKKENEIAAGGRGIWMVKEKVNNKKRVNRKLDT